MTRASGSSVSQHGLPGHVPQRPAPKSIKVLMPVWGLHYTRQFLRYALPTLLAPGNIPALAATLPCEFVALTSNEDAATIRGHPIWRQLSGICSSRIAAIDDLISDASHSTTLTLAYARAVRGASDPLDTIFIFLVSDFLVADGSLSAVVKRMLAGASGVLSGNFQVDADRIAPQLERLRHATGVVTVAPRELVRLALRHMHAVTAGNVVNGDFCLRPSANRLFWQVDAETLLGRFYLMHMIGIRPEVTDFKIGAACDYSFIPEMCPSNNVAVLTDSDDYFVAEMEPAFTLSPGGPACCPFNAKLLADRLSAWTTARHRENVRHSVLLHASGIPAGSAGIAAAADAAIEEIGGYLSPAPQPFRNHPYWIGGLALHQATTGRSPDWDGRGGPVDHRAGWVSILWRLRLAAFGRPPDVRPWHPRAPDFESARRSLRAVLGRRGKLLIISDEPRTFSHWLADLAADRESTDNERLLADPPSHHSRWAGRFDAGLLVLAAKAWESSVALVERILPLLERDGLLVILAVKDLGDEPSFFLADDGSPVAASLVDAMGPACEIRYIHAGPIRRAVQRSLTKTARAARTSAWAYLPLQLITGGILAILSYLCNVVARPVGSHPAGKVCSSVLLILRPKLGSPTALRQRSERHRDPQRDDAEAALCRPFATRVS